MANLAGNLHQDDQSLTPLQRHVQFFDRNKDGIIYPQETYEAFRAIGFNIPMSVLGVIVTSIGVSPATSKTKFPSLSFPIHIENIHLGRHGNDSGVYDEAGRFQPQVFEDLFSKYGKTRRDCMSRKELDEMRASFHRDPSLMGKIGSFVEWRFVYSALKDQEGFVHKEDVRGVYDGSIFYRLEERLKKEKECKRSAGHDAIPSLK